jgi:hypothetical protein
MSEIVNRCGRAVGVTKTQGQNGGNNARHKPSSRTELHAIYLPKFVPIEQLIAALAAKIR